MQQIIKDYLVFEKWVPAHYDFEKLKSAPYIFATYPPNVNYTCVLTNNGNILLPNSSPEISQALEIEKDSIFELACENTLLISFYEDKPVILYNFDTKEITTSFSQKPKIGESQHLLAFGDDSSPVRINKSRLLGVLFLNFSAQLLYGDLRESSIQLLIDSIKFADGIEFTKADERELKRVMFPAADNKLKSTQTADLHRNFKKIFKKKIDKIIDEQEKKKPPVTPLVPSPKEDHGEYLFTEVLKQIPHVVKETPVILDMDLSRYGIKSIKIYPSGTLMIEVVKSDTAGNTFNGIRENIESMLGHSKFALQLFDK
jgi:hypothetical protein